KSASQLVKGSQVVVGGVAAGSVKDIALGDHGQALVTFSADSDSAPLRRGTTAPTRPYSLSALSNRYGPLSRPPSDQAGPAIASRSNALSSTIARFPHFMRQANTTFVNLRATLDDLDPFVNASKPVATRLGPFFHVFRKAAHDAVPTITDLQHTVRRPGAQNDLVELTRDAVPLAHAAIGSGSPDCGNNPNTDYKAAADNNFTQGAFGETVCSLRNGLPALS